ncbi:MAG TPA: prolipoprotein diacylglyceryl transferase [Candidatus Babeliales bacterium]|jgi:phosphatidylglycerol:prolipoprotein diacylglycerol transferase|nr:prolipoprotein diacylglyceryl transferase [Candidatus Babeliales bacterium]
MKLNFSPELIHIYGPFGIHSYGLFIALGIVVSIIAIRRNERFKQMSLENSYIDIIVVSVLAGCIGGRLLAIVSEPFLYPHWYDWFAFWQGGFSALGSILGVITVVPLYLKKINVPILPLFDLVSIYMPLLQSIGRLGCLTAGCCYGAATHNIYAIVYTNPHTLAPHNISIHPTQLYSSAILFFIFLFMYFVGQRICKKNGELFALYLMLVSSERFFVDFWRADRIMIGNFLSFHQLVALTIIIAIIIYYAVTKIISTKK